MGEVRCHIAISMDGFVAGPNQSLENPIGEGGMRLHEWMFETAGWRAHQGMEGGVDNLDSAVIEDAVRGVGAYVMGRKMFGGGAGPWDETWKGWWGDEPPYHAPVFVLTHHPRQPLSMRGGTTFTFVTEGVDAAIGQARAAAGSRDVAVAGGASAVRQVLAAGMLDELFLHIVPIVLGSGERLLEDAGSPTFEPVEVIASPAVTHIRYRVVRPPLG
jgi:dihydrofolate reductase